ncbi:Importin subunit alpha-7 [Bienertia sinuspersici]
MDSRRSSSADEATKIREKHQSLLQDYLILQKECVSKKRKLKEAKERKEILLDEIRFLKHRRNLLLKMQAQDSERQQGAIQSQKAHVKYEVGPSVRYASTIEPTFENSRPALGSIWNSGSAPEEEVGFAPVKIPKKPKDVFANGKRAEKRKISWQDQLALKV